MFDKYSVPQVGSARPDWDFLIQYISNWADLKGLSIRDAVVLVPFAQQLNALRHAWADKSGWQPRIETTQTLAERLGPSEHPEVGYLCFDAATDRLSARLLLAEQKWLNDLGKSNPNGFEEAVEAIVSTAQGLARASFSLHPNCRSAFWEAGRQAISTDANPGQWERALALMAIEWAALTPVPATDRLFALKPSAWIIIKAGGLNKLTQTLIQDDHASAPVLVLDTDPPVEEPLSEIAKSSSVQIAVCNDFEDEANAAAAQIIRHVNERATPVGLVAQDRVLVRRIKAILERQGVQAHDETGWVLSTTRPGAIIMSLLAAAQWQATSDDVLNWLKSSSKVGAELTRDREAVHSLESAMRKFGWTSPASVRTEELSDAAKVLWSQYQALIERLTGVGRQTLAEWLACLQSVMEKSGDLDAVKEDAAGLQALKSLRLEGTVGCPQIWVEATQLTTMDLQEFTGFIGAILEESAYIPQSAPEAACQVVITPLARTMLREFAAVVLPCADEKRLAGALIPHPLLSESLVAAVGLPSAEERRTTELLAFSQAMKAPAVTILRRRHDGSEPLNASSLVLRLETAYAALSQQLQSWTDPRIMLTTQRSPVSPPEPTKAGFSVERLSASRIEALRACPYQFFAQSILEVRETPELEEGIEKRDYGMWLDAILLKFHTEREEPRPLEVEESRMLAIGAEMAKRMALPEADMLPFQASFEELVPRYLKWLHTRDRAGLAWKASEVEMESKIPEWGDVAMFSRIDRLDTGIVDGRRVFELIDYKSGNLEVLKAKARSGFEDTQGLFYTAQLSNQEDVKGKDSLISMSYLALDDKSSPVPLQHEDCLEESKVFVREIGRELDEIRGGAKLRALGEGRTCEYCIARGICRRDQWSQN